MIVTRGTAAQAGLGWLTSSGLAASHRHLSSSAPRELVCSLSTFEATGPDPALFSHAGSISLDNLQSLSSDNATMAMQQAMLAAHEDSLDGTEEEDEDEMEEEEEEELEEEADELQTTNVSDLGLEHSDSLE